MKTLTLLFFNFISLVFLNTFYAQTPMNSIAKNKMVVKWDYVNERIYFQVQAPTTGWLAIGFNTSENIAGNYLIMGNVVDGKSTVKEHYTVSPGNYQPFEELKTTASIKDVEGVEEKNSTLIKFSLPVIATNNYAKNLSKGKEYVLLIAYSAEDDFKHHSMMRTTLTINL
jgi:hypothetical protein